MNFKQNLILFMKLKKMRVGTLNAKAGLSPSMIKKMIDSPHPNPTMITLIKIAQTLEVSIDELIGWKGGYDLSRYKEEK